ncbi:MULTISPECIES: phage holin [unclassified Sporosarcina]|uniref:phage holin n=1 Tax=unclassified Sporosarcina TaxID=2647733 RepID=UPI002041B09E|nr:MULTISPECIES: phage holin [unclassified Sporosarcina]GKV67289.1 hypothetical protein NCCP2331_34420 [Sporosarcina sp. NCCP-2331]GLB57650.1 hypothetical protein NCCP2378_34400 [Sporosarcina sp. NCCP-2378]
MDGKLKEYATLFGGWLSAILLFLGTIGIAFDWFNQESIDAFVVVLMASVPLVIIIYSVWKNTYVSKKARRQEEELKRKGLK